MNSTDGFTLGRPLDIHYTPNKVIIILLSLVLIIQTGWSFYQGSSLMNSFIIGFIQLLLVFLCWAIGRELDPDHDYSAFLGIPLLFVVTVHGNGNIFVLFWFLISLRMINQITGKKITSTDVSMFLILSFIATILSSALLILPLSILIIMVIALFTRDYTGYLILTFPLLPTILLFSLIIPQPFTLITPSVYTLGLITSASLLLFLVIFTTKTLSSTCDDPTKPLSVKRVQSAQLFALLSAMSISMLHGGINFIFPVWAAFIGLGIYRLILVITDYFRPKRINIVN